MSKTISQRQGMFEERLDVSRRYWQLVSGVEPMACYAYCAGHLVRNAGTEAMAGNWRDAAAYLATSFRIASGATCRELVIQLLTGFKRRLDSTISGA